MIGNYTSIYLNRLVMMGDYTIIYLIRLIMVGGSTGCGLLLPVVNYCYLLWFVCSIIAFYIPSARFSPFPFSLFTKIRKCNSHSSFFILHFSFYILHSTFFILHSSFKKSPSVGRVIARYSPCFLPYSLTNINETANNVYFSKKYPQKFW